jgi:hypothetical protein
MAKASPMPADDGLRLNDGDHPQDRRTPAVKLDQERPIKVGELNPSTHLPPQHHQLMPKCGAFGVKPMLRLERRG